MYYGRERYGTRKNPEPAIFPLNYTEESQKDIEDTVSRIKADYPKFNDLQARIWEVLSRYRGDNGLSANAVRYLASCLYEITKDLEKLEYIKTYAEGWKNANAVDWPVGTLGSNAEARNNMWLAGLLDLLDKEDS